MQKIPLGTKARSLGVNRSNVADGQTGRAVLLDPNPRFTYIAYDETIRKRVKVNQDMVIKYGLSPITYYFYLIARLNTDLNGNVVGDKIVVEYLRLSENVNNDFADAIMELGEFTQLKLTKVSKKGAQGQDFGYIKPIPSNQPVDSRILETIEKIRSDEKAIETMWAFIDRDTAITAEEYEVLKSQPQQITQGYQPYGQMPQHTQPATTQPQAGQPMWQQTPTTEQAPPSRPTSSVPTGQIVPGYTVSKTKSSELPPTPKVEGFGSEFSEGDEFEDF